MMTETDVTNAEMTDRLPAVRAVPAEPWEPDEARALLWGVDTLYLSFDLAVSDTRFS